MTNALADFVYVVPSCNLLWAKCGQKLEPMMRKDVCRPETCRIYSCVALTGSLASAMPLPRSILRPISIGASYTRYTPPPALSSLRTLRASSLTSRRSTMRIRRMRHGSSLCMARVKKDSGAVLNGHQCGKCRTAERIKADSICGGF